PAGTTVKFTRSLEDFQPSQGWGYTIYLNGLTQKFSKAATILSNIFQIEFVPSDTASLSPGPYRYAERLVNDGSVDSSLAGETYDITGDELVINIEPNVGSAAAGAFNTWEAQTLVVVEAAISGRLTSDIQAYQIAGRSVSKIPIADLRKIRGELRAAIWRQNNPGQLGVPFRVAFELENESPDYPPTWQDVTGLDR
ncbi:MAG: hypothetical protein ACRD59_03320, partial [Candidatus Acidiferrales bacterium]